MTASPRITVIVMTYNQQDLVGEAIAAALAQDCEPIEILISDDRSSDGTWDAIGRATAGYAGPHRVTLNRNAVNLGITAHLNRCVELAAGDILIGAAGDDVSAPDRVRRIAETFDAGAPLLVHSRVEAISDDPTARMSHEKALFFRSVDPVKAATSFALYVGATIGFHRDLYRTYGPLPARDCYEDMILGFRAALEGRVAFIDAPLVRYRVGGGVSTAARRVAGSAEWRGARASAFRRNLVIVRQRLKDAETFGLPEGHEVRRVLRRSIALQAMRVALLDQGGAGFAQAARQNPILAARVWFDERGRERRARRNWA